ncbi:hypothetical protein PILCRDRAFT_78383 [Piloderma croceum F 1598]|uniref:Uncharacterized protein n=1 Tax=Piloderma croceum (strain F 1598) TaxID=765440 RepID=A0A0C3ETL1_PILCF|nr:hypothetical protein PILCRDRAFT_78383 [Piloderma croceum F 1598]
MKVSGDLTNEGWFNQRSDTLAWFWWIGQGDNSDGPQMQEFYRVSWLRAKAWFSRWSKELCIIGYEM